jgi:hypothetical protein
MPVPESPGQRGSLPSEAGGEPAGRRLPRLNPAFYASILPSVELADVAYAVASAVENTAHSFLNTTDPRGARRFDQAFRGHAPGDLDTADRMIDWLVGWDPAIQDPLEALLHRVEAATSTSTDG